MAGPIKNIDDHSYTPPPAEIHPVEIIPTRKGHIPAQISSINTPPVEIIPTRKGPSHAPVSKQAQPPPDDLDKFIDLPAENIQVDLSSLMDDIGFGTQ
jgi:hypothetical protein